VRLERLLKDGALNDGDRIALVANGERHTCAELDRKADRLAAALVRAGVAPGEVVAVLMHHSAEAVISIFAALRAGAAVAVLSADAEAERLAPKLGGAGAVAVITEARLGPAAAAVLPLNRAIRLVVLSGGGCPPPSASCLSFEEEVRRDVGPAALAPSEDADAPALVAVEADATGRSHRQVAAAAAALSALLGVGDTDVILNALPLSSDAGIEQLVMAIGAGATLVLEPSFDCPETILRRLAEESVTGFTLGPAMSGELVETRRAAALHLPALRYVAFGATAPPAAHVERLAGLFPAVRVVSAPASGLALAG